MGIEDSGVAVWTHVFTSVEDGTPVPRAYSKAPSRDERGNSPRA